MILDKKNILKIIGIITVSAIIFAAFRNFSSVLGFLGSMAAIFMPFVVGAAIAFVVNVPMRAIEGKLFRNKPKFAKIRRPLALMLTLLIIAAVVAAVFIIVVPQLGETIANLGKQIPDYMKKVQVYVEDIFKEVHHE